MSLKLSGQVTGAHRCTSFFVYYNLVNIYTQTIQKSTASAAHTGIIKKKQKAHARDPVTHPASQEAVDNDAKGPPVNTVAILLPT